MTSLVRRLWRRRPHGERGAAMVAVVYLMVALTAVTTTVAVVATNDIISSGRDQQAASALATADAGVSQALQYIRHNGVGSLRCLEVESDPPVDECAEVPTTTNARWGSPIQPQEVPLDGTPGTCVTGEACYEVWISALTPYDPPAVKTGTYRIHATGYFGGGPGAKAVIVDVEATPGEFPVGVFGEKLDGNGGTRIFNESLFTRDCVSPRHDGSGNGTRFQGIDPYWDQPAAANSTSVVSTANNCGSKGEIHRAGVCNSDGGGALVNDRDSAGGPVTSGPCFRTYQRADGSWYPDGDTTAFTLADLEAYGYRPGGLSDAEYDALKIQAQGLGLHNPAAGNVKDLLDDAVAAGVTHPVIYFDTGADVSLTRTDFPVAFARDPTVPTATCSAPYAVVVVVRQADMVYQGGTTDWRSLAVFVPEGDFTGNGGYNIVGTLFADNITLGGNENWQLDPCYVDNMPGPLLNLTVTTFREDDRTDVG